jgi:hypothetical protein
MRLIFLSAAFVLGFVPVQAALVEVRVLDEHGAPFHGVELRLEGVADGQDRGRYPEAFTDGDGRAVFADIEPGRYRVVPVDRDPPRFVAPADNPLAPAPELTLTGDDDQPSIAMELWRGVALICRADADTRGFVGTVVAREPGYRIEQRLELPAGETRELRVLPGRWEVVYETPPGFLLNSFHVDGREVAGATAAVEPAPLGAPVELVWNLASPAEVVGSLIWKGEPATGLAVEAVLLEPGPWLRKAAARDEQGHETVTANVDNDRFRMVLPDGRWRVRVVGDGLATTEPAHRDVVMRPGGYERVDFVVDPVEAGGVSFIVELRGPGGALLQDPGGAIVEVWPLDPDLRGEAPVASGEMNTDRFPVRGLEPGDWLVIAGKAGFLEAYALARLSGEHVDEPPVVQVALRPGARLRIRAADGDGRPANRVAVVGERLDDEPMPALDDAALLAAATRLPAVTDSTGYVSLEGLWPGRWRFRADWSSGDQRPRFARFTGEDAGGPEIEAVLEEGRETELAVELAPAGALRASLACRDGSPLPATASARVVPSGWSQGDSPTGEGELLLPDLPLRGPLRDTIAVGPLVQDAFRIAVRPVHFERWTWAPGTEVEEEAAEFTVFPGEPVETGTIAIDCTPRVVFFLETLDDESLPDLRRTRERGGGAHAQVLLGGLPHEDEPQIDLSARRIVLRDLPAGELTVRMVVEHPWLMPAGYLEFEVEAQAAPGSLAEFDVDVAGVGGAIHVQGVRGATVRVLGEVAEGTTFWTRELVDGEALFGGLPRGRYDVISCDDAACTRERRRWPRIPVEIGQTTVVP